MENRAKQFIPFSALKGYEEALRAKEKVVVPKIELSDEKKEELNRKLQQVQKNDMITVVYFHQNEYLQMEGMVSRIDKDARILKVVNTRIAFSDIYDLWGANIVEEY
ncbi:MAG: YolD-like family protein [Agathobacter sp.]